MDFMKSFNPRGNMRGDQLARQWRILRHIEASRQGLSVMEMAALENVTRRTIYRDLAALQDAGFPLLTESVEGNRKWAFIDNYKFQVPEPFSITELMALHLYGDFSRMFKGTFFYDSLESLFKKVRATLPQATVAYMERAQTSFSVGIKPYKDYGRFREIINRLSHVLPQRFRVEIAYLPLNAEKETVRKVDPYKLWFFEGTIYLIGFCHLRGEVRTFVLDRIRMLRQTNETFRNPDGFNLDDYLRHSFKVMRAELKEVKILISPAWARWAGEKVWHEGQIAKKLDDGSLELTFLLAGLEEIRQWILSLSPQAIVLEPPELRDMVRQSLEESLLLYGDAEGAESEALFSVGSPRGGLEKDRSMGK